MFPINFVTWYSGNFGLQVVEYARKKGTAVLAIKSMAYTPWKKGEERSFPVWYKPLSKEEDAMFGLRFTLSQPVTAAIPPGDESLFRLALKLAPAFIPLSENDKYNMKQKANGIKPIFEYPSDRFDFVKGKS